MTYLIPLIPAKAGTQDKSAATYLSSLGISGSSVDVLFQPVLDPGLRRDERLCG